MPSTPLFKQTLAPPGVNKSDSLTIVNIYAPTRDYMKQQIVLLTCIFKVLENISAENLIIGGDLNMTLNPELDKYGDPDKDSLYRKPYFKSWKNIT